MFPLGFKVKFAYCHMLQPIAFLAFRAVHRRISSRGRIGPMKMVKACLPTIRLRFGTKPAFDTLTDQQQLCSGIAHWLIEHHELHPAIAFVQPQMVGRVRVYRLKRIGFYEDRTDIVGGFRRGSRSFSGMTAVEPYVAEQPYQNDTCDPDFGMHDISPL